MGVGTLQAPWSVSLGGVLLSVIADPSQPDAEQVAGYSGRFAAQDFTQTLEKRDVPATMSEFRRGSGFIRRRGTQDDGGVGWLENLIGWNNNGITLSYRTFPLPSGIHTNLNRGGTTATDLIVTDSRAFAGHRYCITNGGCVIKFPNDDPSAAPVYEPALDAFTAGTPKTSLRPGYNCTGIEVFPIPANATTGLFDAAAGVPTDALVVSAYNGATNKTRVYYTTLPMGGTWVESAADFAAFQIRHSLVGPVWWQGPSDAGAQRLLGADDYVVKHCIYGSDPTLEASWIGPILIPAQIQKLRAFPQFAYAITAKGIYTFNGVRSMNVTPYWRTTASITNAAAATIYNSAIVTPRGAGLDYYNAAQDYRRQDDPVEVGPMKFFQDGTPIRGQITAMVQHENALICALYNNERHATYIGRMIPKEDIGVEVPGLFAQYWSEYLQEGAGGIGPQVTHLAVSSPTVAATVTLPAKTVNIWMFLADEPFAANKRFYLTYGALPTGSGPLSYQVSSGTFAYTLNGTAYLTAQNHDDDHAVKYLRVLDTLTSGVSGAKFLNWSSRADGDPTTILDGTSWPAIGTAQTLDNLTLSMASVHGHSIGLKAVFGTDVNNRSPVLNAVSMRAKVAKAQFKTLTLWAIMERDYELSTGVPDIRDPDETLAAIVAMQDAGPQDYYDEESIGPPSGTPQKVYVEQGQTFQRVQVSEYEFMTLLRIDLSLIT